MFCGGALPSREKEPGALGCESKGCNQLLAPLQIWKLRGVGTDGRKAFSVIRLLARRGRDGIDSRVSDFEARTAFWSITKFLHWTSERNGTRYCLGCAPVNPHAARTANEALGDAVVFCGIIVLHRFKRAPPTYGVSLQPLWGLELWGV